MRKDPVAFTEQEAQWMEGSAGYKDEVNDLKFFFQQAKKYTFHVVVLAKWDAQDI